MKLCIKPLLFFVVVTSAYVTAMQPDEPGSGETISRVYREAWKNDAHKKAGELITRLCLCPYGNNVALSGTNPETGKSSLNINGGLYKENNIHAFTSPGPLYDCAWGARCIAYSQSDQGGAYSLKVKGAWTQVHYHYFLKLLSMMKDFITTPYWEEVVRR